MLLKFDAPQPQGVGDDGHRRQGHRRRCNHGRQEKVEDRVEHAGCNRHAGGVVDEGEEQVLHDVAQRRLRQLAGAHDAGQVTAEQRQTGAFDRPRRRARARRSLRRQPWQ